MKTRITLTLDQLTEQERKDLTYLLTDALAEFVAQREDTEAYLAKRYPDASAYLWDAKRIEVPARVALAKRLKLAAHEMVLTDEEEGLRKFVVNKAGDVELRLDAKHVLIINAADEGVVLDAWEDGGKESLWSTYHYYIEMLEDDEQVKCQNCEWVGPESACKEIQHLTQRVAVGEPMPVGECPKCGALCHPVEE